MKSDAVIIKNKRKKGGIAQLARASALQAEGRRFDSDYLHKKEVIIPMASFFVETILPSRVVRRAEKSISGHCCRPIMSIIPKISYLS